MADKKEPSERMEETARDQVKLDREQGTRNARDEYERLNKLEDRSVGNELARKAYEKAILAEEEERKNDKK